MLGYILVRMFVRFWQTYVLKIYPNICFHIGLGYPATYVLLSTHVCCVRRTAHTYVLRPVHIFSAYVYGKYTCLFRAMHAAV